MSELGDIQKSFAESVKIRMFTDGLTKAQAVADLRLQLESLVADQLAVAVDPIADQEDFAVWTRLTAQLALFISWVQSEGL